MNNYLEHNNLKNLKEDKDFACGQSFNGKWS